MEVAGVAFEVERLEVTGGDRLEVTGRWTGVRGMRFVRPSLIVRSDEGERSVLAVLDHKPWAPVEGRSWVAAFPWAGDPVDPRRAELAVAPSIVVPLARPSRTPARRRTKTKDSLLEDLDAERARVRHLEAEVAFLREQRELLTARVAQAEAEGDGRRAAAEEAVSEEHEARVQADELVRIEREAALLERESAAGERESAAREREQLRRELARVRRERDDAEARLGEVVAERDAALAGRDAARVAARVHPVPPHITATRSAGRMPTEWVTRGLAIAAAICLLLLAIGLLRIL